MGSVHLDSKYNNPEVFILGLTDSNHVVLLFKAVLIFGVISYKLKMGVRNFKRHDHLSIMFTNDTPLSIQYCKVITFILALNQ